MTSPAPQLTPPADPRSGWRLPAPGGMPSVTELSELTSRVLAPNPSHMTLDGTNTYIVAVPGSGAAVVVDPGPDNPDHYSRVERRLAERDLACELVLVTHHHFDHTEAARKWAGSFGCRVAAPSTRVVGDDIQLVQDGDHFRLGGLDIEAVSTPGHCFDHTAYRLPDGSLLTGDHILGRGTSVVAWPEGDLTAYLSSLRRVLELGPDVLYPGHGPELTEDPGSVVRFYLEHRAFREAQVLAAMADGIDEPAEMVRRIYADVPEILWSAAELSTRAALDKLVAEGRARQDDKRFQLVD